MQRRALMTPALQISDRVPEPQPLLQGCPLTVSAALHTARHFSASQREDGLDQATRIALAALTVTPHGLRLLALN
jgi:hypothetical protein